MERTLQVELSAALTNIYSIDIIPFLAGFLQGEQAVMIALLRLNINAPTEICKVTGIAKNRMSAIINSLKRKGYIHVATAESDKRKINLELTYIGKNVIEDKENDAIMFFERFIDAVGETNTKELIRIVNLAVEKLGSDK